MLRGWLGVPGCCWHVKCIFLLTTNATHAVPLGREGFPQMRSLPCGTVTGVGTWAAGIRSGTVFSLGRSSCSPSWCWGEGRCCTGIPGANGRRTRDSPPPAPIAAGAFTTPSCAAPPVAVSSSGTARNAPASWSMTGNTVRRVAPNSLPRRKRDPAQQPRRVGNGQPSRMDVRNQHLHKEDMS